MIGGLLVLGVGNLLLGDEGVGIHAVRQLAADQLPDGVAVVDGGTGGFHLLGYLQDFPEAIIVDATLDGRAPGTVTVTSPRYASDYPASLSAHDIGLRDLIQSAALLGALPRVDLVTVSVDRLQPMTMTLSPEIAAAMPEVIATIDALIAARTAVAHA